MNTIPGCIQERCSVHQYVLSTACHTLSHIGGYTEQDIFFCTQRRLCFSLQGQAAKPSVGHYRNAQLIKVWRKRNQETKDASRSLNLFKSSCLRRRRQINDTALRTYHGKHIYSTRCIHYRNLLASSNKLTYFTTCRMIS